jgi:peptide/nickel transport system substrate-binding protein
MKEKLNRRTFLRLSAMAAAGAAAVACQPQTVVVKETVEVEKEVTKVVEKEVEKEVTTVVEKEVTTVVEKEKVVEVEEISERQSPVLAEMVKSGALPPLEDRLPVSAKVCTDGVELPRSDLHVEVGKYGGNMRSVHTNASGSAVLRIAFQEPVVNAPGVGVREPGVIWENVVRSFKVSDQEKVFTFQLREGMKWSDGEPLTTEDVRFGYEDVISNEQITPSVPYWLRAANKPDGEPLVLEVIDAYTFKVTFAEPYGGFLTNLALVSWRAFQDLIKPKHYLAQFHADYTPLADLEPLIEEESLAAGEWWTLFTSKDTTCAQMMQPRALGFPTLAAWVVQQITDTRVYFERNPYYWKVDVEGNQLPYIDHVESELVQDMEMINIKVMAGEVDFISYGTGGVTAKNLPLYKENADRAGYTVHLLNVHNTPTNVFFNLSYEDPVWRQVVHDLRFRHAVNMAINREEILDAVYFGLAELPWQLPSEYNPDEANRLLDEMGLDKRDADGWRLGPDGQTFEIPFQVGEYAEDIVPVTELIVEHWKAVGLKTTMKVEATSLVSERNGANQLKVHVIWNATLTMWWQIWGMTPNVGWAPLWYIWINSNGEQGEEPPEEARRFTELVLQSVAVNPESAEREAIIKEYLDIFYEQMYSMPTVIEVKAPLILHKDIKNVATDGYAIAAYYAAEQWYYDV